MHDDAHEEHDHDRGLAFDLSTLGRRHVLKLLGGAGLLALVSCGSSDGGTSGATTAGSTASTTGSTATTTAGPTASTTGTTATSDGADCSPIPEETGGPYPGDGSNGPNVLTESGIVRSDIRSSFGSATGVADGVPLTVELTIQDSACAALPGAAVYLWHCDREGRYSLYSDGVTGENYLRGVQEAGADGVVTFSTIFPGAYSGRWPHIHFEVYPSLAEATSAGSILVTSQLALPEDACNLVYATDGYGESVRNLAQTSLATDNVFGDGYEEQLATVSGDVAGGFTAELTLSVPA